MKKQCPIYETANLMGKRWTLLVILEVYKGGNSRRYSEIKGKVEGITPKILSLRLKELEKEGLVKKKIDSSSFPVKCEYSLTPKGTDFLAILKKIKGWSLKWNKCKIHCSNTDCSYCNL